MTVGKLCETLKKIFVKDWRAQTMNAEFLLYLNMFLNCVRINLLASDDMLIPEEMFTCMCGMQFVTRKWHTNNQNISKVKNLWTLIA